MIKGITKYNCTTKWGGKRSTTANGKKKQYKKHSNVRNEEHT